LSINKKADGFDSKMDIPFVIPSFIEDPYITIQKKPVLFKIYIQNICGSC
jgi:hypothetical protein